MEWVEVTGKSVAEAKEAALEQLGVAERDAELIVVTEPKTGLFGRVRGEARVRARVQPVGPRPKRTRRPRDQGGREAGQGSGGSRSGGRGGGRSRDGRQDGGRQNGDRPRGSATVAQSAASTREANAEDDDGFVPQDSDPDGGQSRAGGERPAGSGSSGSGTSRSARRRRSRAAAKAVGGGEGRPGPGGARQGRTNDRVDAVTNEEADMAEGMTLEEQAEVAKGFLEGLLARYGLEAAVDIRVLDDDTVEIAATGDGLGILVGPKGATLAALQDVTRTVVQRQFPSRTDRILVDVAGYREKRAAALQRFSQQVASEVVATGAERALEPMSPADRKVVHDSLKDVDGVATRSEGEDPTRYIVIAPAG